MPGCDPKTGPQCGTRLDERERAHAQADWAHTHALHGQGHCFLVAENLAKKTGQKEGALLLVSHLFFVVNDQTQEPAAMGPAQSPGGCAPEQRGTKQLVGNKKKYTSSYPQQGGNVEPAVHLPWSTSAVLETRKSKAGASLRPRGMQPLAAA